MNLKLTDHEIEATCRRLLARNPRASGRALRAELKRDFGVPGKTDRVFAVWRRLRAETGDGPPTQDPRAEKLAREIETLNASLHASEGALAAALDRARLAELREIAHQDRWAGEIHALREEVRRLAGEGRRRIDLESRVLDLSRELAQLRLRLAAYESRPGEAVAEP